jgi:hypothetical protein
VQVPDELFLGAAGLLPGHLDPTRADYEECVPDGALGEGEGLLPLQFTIYLQSSALDWRPSMPAMLIFAGLRT